MLTDDVEHYLALRRSLGFKLQKVTAHLRSFARFALERGDSHVKAATAVEWASLASTPGQRSSRLRCAVRLAHFLRAENPAHEVPPERMFVYRAVRPVPYIYTQDELARILEEASQLRGSVITPLRAQLYVALFGLVAATGLRLSEALCLKTEDILPGGILRIEKTKFNKSRLVPLHPTVSGALDRYLKLRRQEGPPGDYVFANCDGRQMAQNSVRAVFHVVLRRAEIAPHRQRMPRLTDLRHTFATRALQRCAAKSASVCRHFVALSTYLGHSNAKHTYWYLQATPDLMADMAAKAEKLAQGRLA
jgi:integrase/recombinase XerD